MEGDLGTPLRPGQREQLEKCPPEVRPTLRKLYHRVYFAYEALQERGRLRHLIEGLRQRLGSEADDSDLEQELRMHEAWLTQAEKRYAEIVDEVSKATSEYTSHLREWRLRGVPPEGREEALAILQEEVEVLRAARQAYQTEARELLLALREREAGLSIRTLMPGSERAVPDQEGADIWRDGAARADDLRAKYSEICAAIREEHDRQVRALAHEELR